MAISKYLFLANTKAYIVYDTEAIKKKLDKEVYNNIIDRDVDVDTE